jgi:hypothetical protein
MPMRLTLLLSLLCSLAAAQRVRVEFNPQDPAYGPFPNDYLTQPDPRQKTGLRVNLPLAGCIAGGECEELDLVNALDGFHVIPRITVRFSGPVNIDTLRDGIFIVWLDPAYPRSHSMEPSGSIMPVNQLQWDPATNTAYVRPDQMLEQGRRYALLVTRQVKDWNGQSVVSDPGFDLCLRKQVGGDYCAAVSQAVNALPDAGIVGGSVFTTLSATAWLESVYQATKSLPVAFARTGPGVIATSDIRQVTWRQQVGASSADPLLDVPLALMGTQLVPNGIGKIAFGSIRSPRFLNSRFTIDPQPTAAPVAVPAQSEEIFFHVLLPSSPAPPGGYPVLLSAHGLTDSRFGTPTLMAVALAQSGYAVVAMSAVGHGYGPASVLRITTATGTIDVPTPGRGADIDGNGAIDSSEGCVVIAPGAPFVDRDCIRQTAADYFALIRAIHSGLDLLGDGSTVVSRTSIAVYGNSLGSYYGSLAAAIDPDLPAGVFSVNGGSILEAIRYSPTLRQLGISYFAQRKPLLLNSAGDFDEQYPLRYQAVQVLERPNAAAVGEALDRLDWIQSSGNPMSYAPYFRWATLDDNPIKRVLIQIAVGDQTVPNPANSQFIRAANLREFTSVYRHDLAVPLAPELPDNPHSYLSWLIASPAGRAIAGAGLAQAGAFLAGQGDSVPDANSLVHPIFGKDLFEIPALPPELPNFIKR